MIASWMIYATVVSVVLGLAATLLDSAAATVVRQRRWIWVAAIALSVAIPVRTGLAPRVDRVAAATDKAAGRGGVLRRAPMIHADDALARLIARAEASSLGNLDSLLGVIWGGSALLALAVYGLGTWSIARRRRSWREAAIDGQRVLLAPATGPAVIGALRPAIVVPEWSIDLPAEQRALMLEHERQHVTARDPLILHATAAAVILTPWNPGAWWMVRRLRLAVEMDCDARVLAAGRDARAYGNLLLDVCTRRIRSHTMLSPALFERTSSLTRRILAMHPVRSRFASTRCALGTVVAAGMAFVACDVPSPAALAPGGTNQANRRLYGDVTIATTSRDQTVQATVARYFPGIARGEGGPSVLFIARSATGEVLLTETQPARDLTGQARTAKRVTASANGARANPPAGATRSMPPAIAELRPEDIAAVDVSKYAAGTVAPNAISLITIRLKTDAVMPRPNTLSR